MKTSQPIGAAGQGPAQGPGQGPGPGQPGQGAAGLGMATGQRLPVPPRERRPALAALAVLLILGGALTSAYLVMASGQRVSAIRISQPVAAGQQIPAGALEEVQIGNTGIEFISWAERGRVTEAYAAVPLVKGALLTNGMVARDGTAAGGRVIVGLALKPGQLPAGGLQPGDRVSLYGVGGQNAVGVRAGPLAEDAVVYGVATAGEQTLQSDQTMISVAVPPEQAPQVTQAASAGAVAVALIPAGTKVPAGAPAPAGPPSGQPGGQQPATPSTGGG
ncbi:MAG: hypothetical protein ACRDOO_05895 [Actinomadura sp.]